MSRGTPPSTEKTAATPVMHRRFDPPHIAGCNHVMASASRSRCVALTGLTDPPANDMLPPDPQASTESPDGSVGRSVNWRLTFGIVLAALVVGPLAVGPLLPAAEPVVGPPLADPLTGIAVDGWTETSPPTDIHDNTELDGVVFIVDPEACTRSAAAEWAAADELITLVVLCRTGTEDSARKLAQLEVAFGDPEFERDPDGFPNGASVGHETTPGVNEVVVGWAVADVIGIVVANGPDGTTTLRDSARAWSLAVDESLQASGFDAPWVGKPARVLGATVFAGVMILVVLRVVRALIRAIRAPQRRKLTLQTAASVDVTERAEQIRWMGRVVGLVQGATFVALPSVFFIGLLWAERLGVGFFASVLIAPGVLAALGIASTKLWRWLDGEREHRWRFRRRRLRSAAFAAVGLVVVSVALLGLGMVSTSTAVDTELQDRMTAAGRDLYGPASVVTVVIGAVIVLGLFSLADLLFRRSRRALAQSFGDIAEDGDEPALLLRSFGDDELSVRSDASARTGLVDAWSLRSVDRFEEVLAWELSNDGPTIAVSEPGKVSSRGLGAVKVPLDDGQWQGWVTDRMAESPLILCVLGSTPGFVWEMQQLRARELLDKAAIIVPPRPAPELIRRWVWLARNLSGNWMTPVPGGIESALAVMVDRTGRVWSAGGARRDEANYRAAVEACRERSADRRRRPGGLGRDPAGFPGTPGRTVMSR